MWLRHALKLIAFLSVLSACSPQNRQAVDKLNSLSYAYHYRDLDSTEHYAREAFNASADYKDGRAEALNNLAFVSIARMQYDKAKLQLDSIYELTDNQLELMVADVLQMRLCQRRSHNREFYDYRSSAAKALHRIDEERDQLSQRQLARLLYAQSEMAIVTSTYYYYVGQEQQSIDALLAIDSDVENDTAQWMNYLYNVGAGGIITEGTPYEIGQNELACLQQCLHLAQKFGSPFFFGNSLEAMAEHLINDATAVDLAEEALEQFVSYGDVYQLSGAFRTLASCHRAQGNYDKALYYLEQALADSAIYQASDLVASIHEQLSVAYSAINDKEQSDINRNIYLDLQEQTRQDRSLEARAGQLDAAVDQLNTLLIAVAVVLVLLIAALRLFYLIYQRSMKKQEALDELHEQREELQEALTMQVLKREENERRNLEQRAKISLVNSILPLIDRMLHDVQRLGTNPEHDEDRLQYIKELTEKINEQNDVLTHWIQLRQGELSLHVETFDLQPLFDIIAKSRRSFMLKGITLNIEPADIRVKADRVLTLFMLNTLADNARKFTNEGGEVTVSASQTPDYVEISVADTGIGMTEEELSHVFDQKVSGGHGFGLQNCRGIIEKYKKTSKIFSVCKLSAESEVGKGSRFFFRLPNGIVRLILLLCLFAPKAAHAENILLQQASDYADSAYYSNIQGNYRRTLHFADSCLHSLNQYYLQKHPRSADTLMLYSDETANLPEITWLHNGMALNYNILLVARNESAVASLALHEWQFYNYNNRIYTLLFKELSADRNLDDYCRKMQQSQTDRSVAVILLVMMVLALLIVVAIQVIQAVGRKADRQQEQQAELEMLGDELRREEMEEARLHVSNQVLENCLSTLKHETMYYPSRISQLIDSGNTAALPEVTGYYREIYGILSEQAGRQIENAKLHLTRLQHDIFGDRVLIDFLFDLLRRQARQKSLHVDYAEKDGQYVVCTVEMPGVPTTDFMPSTDNINYLLCRQIVREHGEATGCHACGIRSEQSEQGSLIIITLPRYICRSSK